MSTEILSRRYALGCRPAAAEQRREFGCFGGSCAVIVADPADPQAAAMATQHAQRQLLDWHRRFSRFDPDSELSRLNRDPGRELAVSPVMARLVQAALDAYAQSEGLVDATLGAEIEQAGYGSHFEGDGLDLALALELAPARTPAGPSRRSACDLIAVDPAGPAVRRPPGTRIDPGGIAKGLFADQLGAQLRANHAFAIDCGGDIRLGGTGLVAREVHVTSPFDAGTLHTFRLRMGAVATSGIAKRSWLGSDGLPAHHLLDPATGRPAFTGVVQATALAPTAARAEVLAKAAILSGPDRAAWWLPHGGVIVADDGSCQIVDPVALDGSEAPVRRAPSHARRSASTSSRSGSLRISW
jgi:thiamine biosynthesis lipoprotein